MKILATGSATLSVLDYWDSKWTCEICASVVIKKGDEGETGVFKVEISESGSISFPDYKIEVPTSLYAMPLATR